MKIIIKGRIPSKKNSKIIVCRGKFPMLLPSKSYSEWHKEASIQLIGIKKVKKVSKIEIIIYPPDKRKSDLSNKIEGLMDLLVDVGILKDDNWFECGDIRMIFGGIDRENPRAEIEIIS